VRVSRAERDEKGRRERLDHLGEVDSAIQVLPRERERKRERARPRFIAYPNDRVPLIARTRTHPRGGGTQRGKKSLAAARELRLSPAHRIRASMFFDSLSAMSRSRSKSARKSARRSLEIELIGVIKMRILVRSAAIPRATYLAGKVRKMCFFCTPTPRGLVHVNER